VGPTLGLQFRVERRLRDIGAAEIDPALAHVVDDARSAGDAQVDGKQRMARGQ
jgi:hypothetical protein